MKLLCALGALCVALTFTTPLAAADKPNVILLLGDDVGYGDVGCYGAKPQHVKTPNIDRLASQGLRFTDAHAESSTCTPSRFSIMTGTYAWRQKGTGILPGNAKLIIDPSKITFPAVMQKAGYATAAIGKWHMGLGDGTLDWNKDIKPGPLELGFDYCFILPATGDRTPCVYVENHRIVNLDPKDPIEVNYKEKIGNEPTGREHPELLKMKLSAGHADTIVNGISRIGFMSGGHSAWWKDDTMADTLTQKALGFIERSKDQNKPFFLYLATHDIHVPRVPNQRFVGKSGCGVRGDVIEELDWTLGAVMQELDKLGIADNTLLIFTSDNGPVVDDGYDDGALQNLNGHEPQGPFRGGKYSLYEGGTRVPFIARWPGHIKPATTSSALICQVDLLASMAAFTGVTAEAPDSINVLPALLGQSDKGRDHLVEQPTQQTPLGIRLGNWKFLQHSTGEGGGRESKAGGKKAKGKGKAAGGQPELYDLSKDLGETRNVAAERPDTVKQMESLLEQIRRNGHETR